MKVCINIVNENEEEIVRFHIHKINPEIDKLVSSIKHTNQVIYGKDGEITYKIFHSEIYYIESVDKKCYLYTDKTVLNTSYRLYQLEELLDRNIFMRISKSMIVNLDKIISMKPTLSGRFEATLDNNEKITISRTYVKKMKDQLGIIKE